MLIDFSLLINGSIKWHGLRGRARLHGAHKRGDFNVRAFPPSSFNLLVGGVAECVV